MTVTQWLFSFKGRISRSRFWTWTAIYYASFLAAIALLPQSGGFGNLILLVVGFVLLIPDLAVQAKRWHDRDKSLWWLLLNVPIIADRLMRTALDSSAAQESLQTAVSIIAIVSGCWLFIQCGFLKGTEGPNRYGLAVNDVVK
ncbi:DUF805 domain-containing protein [Aliivibrio kagoshimensis]|jgi:uncharacterized membrane protein YhaH (DUF805 family)|uniref:DUF805 domain-containing protein n=1 Tax=Aliivibrio kagoshimensis TaxID=2910230 RepID=UPI003D10F912